MLSSANALSGRGIGSEEHLVVVDGADRGVSDSLASDLLTVRLAIDGEGPSGESTSASLIAGAGVVPCDGDSVLMPAPLVHLLRAAFEQKPSFVRCLKTALSDECC